jgi:hypothetical protein
MEKRDTNPSTLNVIGTTGNGGMIESESSKSTEKVPSILQHSAMGWISDSQ